MFKMASLKDKSNKLLLGVVHNKTMADAKNDNRVVDIDTLRQFTIPKMRKAKHELLESVPTSSVQYQREILQVLQQSYQDRKSTDRFIYSQPKLVHNAPLLNEFLEKRKAMRQDRTEKELQDTYGFIAVKTESEAKKYCAEGITIGNSSMMCLGNPAMGVYLCKHADLLQPSQFFDGQSGYIVIFKIIKGKTKLMVENRVGEALDPTPDFDCHLSKNVNVDLTSVSVQEAYESTQLYVYEYTEDLDVTERPRQVVPHALVSFRFVASGSSQQKLTTAKKVWLPSEYASRQTSSRMSPGAESVLAVNSGLSKRSGADGVTHPAAQRVKNEISVGYDAADNGEIVWTGQLCIESAVISDVELVSYSNLYLPWHLEPWLYLDHDRIGYDEIVKYYELGKLGILPRNQECTASGKFYNYCELRPMNEMSKNFIRAVNFISKSKCGSRIKLTKGVDLIILPHCTITYKLGLCSKRPDQVVLHCIIISTMSSSYQQDTMSKPNEGVSLRPNEIPFNSHILESGLDIAGTMRHVPSRSLRQSLQFMQAYPSMSPDEQTLLRHGQHGSIPFSPFPAATPGDVVHPLGLSSTADVPFSLSKQRHYDPRLVRRLEMPSEFLPHITSDDVLRLNLPAADLPSALQTGAGEGGCPEQNSTGSGGMRHESLQERIDRMQAEMEARGSPVRYYQSDTDTETEYSASSRFPARGSSSSISEEDEELELDIIKLRRPTALGQLETNTDGEQTNEEAMEVDEGNMADDLVDEIVRMKPLQAKAARETFGEAFEEEKAPDGEPTESVSLTDCLFIDFDVEVETSSDEEVTTDNEKTSADDDLSVIKSVLLTSSSAAKPVHSAVEDESAAEPNEDVANEKDGLSIESSEPVQLVEMSEERPSPKEVPEILSPTSSDVHSNDNLRVPPALSVDVAVSPRPTEENDLNSRIASADEAVNSKGLASPAQPEACLDESSQVVSDTARTVTFVETGKLSIEIHSDAPSTSASAERIAEVATSSHGPKEQIRVVIEEEQLDGCVASVLHRGAKRRCHPPASSEREEEAERQLEMIWRLGLHYLAFFQDGDDDDNREINAEEVPSVRPKTGHTGTFGDTVNREPVHLNNKSKPVGLSSAANKWNRVQQLGVCSSTCTTDVARPKRRSRSISSGRQDSYYRYRSNSSYDDESPYQNRTSDYQFRDDRVHPYYRRQDGTRARIDREDFYKVYREHRNIEELLKCLTHSQFESRRTRPILTHLTSSSPVEGSAQSSPRFISRRFQRSTWAEANDTLGRREKVDDCLEDEMFGKDEVPNFYEKKAIAEAFDDNFRPAATESEKSQQRSSSGVSNTPHITSNAVAASETAADGSSDSKPGEVTNMTASSAEFSCLSFTNSQILIPFLEDVASPSVDDSVSAVHTEDSTGVKPRSEIQFCRTGKMEMKWPSHLTTVDIPASRPEFHYAGVSSGLLELVSSEIISSCDPRLSASVPNTSVYASLAHGTQTTSSVLQRGSGKQGLAGEDRSMEGLGEELREMAKNLKVRVHINPKFLPILADRAAIAGGSASVASLLQGRMDDLDQVQGSKHETLSAQNPGKDRKLGSGLEKDAPRKRIQPVSKLPPKTESQAEGRTSLNLDSRPSGPTQRAAEGHLGQGSSSEGKGYLTRVKVDPENKTSEFNQDRPKQSELRYEMERDENDRLVAEVVCGASSSVVLSGPALTDRQKAAVHRTEEFLPQGGLSPEFLVSIKQERHSAPECSSDESSVTGKSRGSAPVDGNRISTVGGPATGDLVGVDQGQGLETDGNGKGGATRDSNAYLRKQDKQKLKEEVLLLEKMVAEKKALQVERENRERNGGKLTSKDRLLQQQRIVATDNRETRKSQHKSATSTTERLRRRLLLEEKQRATAAATMDRAGRPGVDERHRLGPDDRSVGERLTPGASIAPSVENKVRRDSQASDRQSDNQECSRMSDDRVKPASVPGAVEEKPRKPMTSDYKETALTSDSQERRKIDDQSPRGEAMAAAHESVLKELPKKREGWPERQRVPALFPAFENSNVLQSKAKVPAVNNDSEQPLRSAEASQEHSKLTRPKASTLKFSKESEEQKREEQKCVFQSPQHNTEVRDTVNVSLSRTPVDINDPAVCSCGFKKGTKLTVEQCEFCLRRQLLGDIENLTESSSSSAMSNPAKFPSPESVLPSAGLQEEVVSSNVQGKSVSDVDGTVKNFTDGESLDTVDSTPVHLPCLCPETQFESQFYDCAPLRRIHLEATREWMREKPLEMLICGRLKEVPRLLPWLPADSANDPLIMNCLTSFGQSMDEILEELTAPEEDVTGSDDEVLGTETVAAEEPPCATEQLANSLFEEVRQHLEFLSEKSLLQNMDVTGQSSDPAEGDACVEEVTPRVRGPEVLQTMPVLKKPSRYSTAKNTGMETKTAPHCDVSSSEVLSSHITLHSSPHQVVRDEDQSSCHEEPYYIEDAEISQAQLPTKDPVYEAKILEPTLAHSYKSRVPQSTGSERLRERSSADVPRVPRSHEMEPGWRRGAARGRGIPLRRRGLDSERNFYQNRGREAVDGPRGDYVRLTENQYRMKESPHGSHKRRKHSRNQGEDRNDPKVSTAGGKVEGHEPKRLRKEKVKEPNRDLEGEVDAQEEKLEKTEPPEKKLERVEPSKELASSEVKDLRRGTKKAKKNKKERQEGDSGKKVKEKREKKRVKKKKKSEAEKVSDQLLLEKPVDTKVALSHLLSDAAESAFAQANTDSGSAFAQLNDDPRKDENDPNSIEPVETQAALDFQNLFKCPSDVKTPQADVSLSSPPLMKCFLDKNIDYADVMHKLADVIPGTGNFDAKRLTPQTSFVWALALAVFKDEGKASEAVRGSEKFEQNLFDEECCDFADAYEVGEDKDAALDSYQSADGETVEHGDKTSAQKSPGGRGSNLMQAFRQVVEAKRRAQELTKAKLGLSKLSPELAAKRAAPKAAKPLFKPPTTPDPAALLNNTSSGRFIARPVVLNPAAKHLAENLAKDAFSKVWKELERLLEEYCGLNNLERTVPPPLKFYLMYTHFAPLSLVAISLYKSVACAIEEEALAADQRISECTKESPLGSASNSLKRKRADAADLMVCALLKKPREQTSYGILGKDKEEILQANLVVKDVALGSNTKVVPASLKLKTSEGSNPAEQPYLGPEDFYPQDYLLESDDCEGLNNNNSLTDESQSPPNMDNNFMSESDNISSSVVTTTNAEIPCETAVTNSSHQRFLNAKGPRFMQTFRQNQIAKRRSQKENLRTATGGKLVHSKHTLTVGVVKPKPIGMTLEETLAVLSGHHSPASSTSVSVTPSTSGTSILSTDVSATLSKDVSAEVVPTNATNRSPPPKITSEDVLSIETVMTQRSPTTHALQDLTAIPLPPCALPEDSFDAMDIGSPSESSATVELGTSFSVSPVTVPYATLPISCSTSFSSSFLISSSSDCYSGYEVSCAPPSGHLTSYLLPTPSAQTDDTQLEDSSTAVNIPPPPYSVSSAADASQMMNSDWQYEYFPPPVDLPPPVSYPSMPAEQPVQPSCVMPQHFPSPRPYLLETPPDIQPAPYPCMPNEMPPRYPHPCPDQMAWDNNPHPPPHAFPPPHPPQGLPWRGGRPPPPMNMMMPPDGGRPRFRQPPPGMNPNSPIMGPKRPLLLRPPSSSSGRGGLLPHPGCMPPPFAPGFRERSASDPGLSREDGNGQQPQPMSSASEIRMYIFNKDKGICKSIQRFLDFLGARAFDPYNIDTLHVAPDDVCMVLIHEGDLGILHRIPNLLRLKRDNRVTFSGYYDVMDVKFKKYIPLFPSAGLIVFDNAALLSCTSESLQLLCEFAQLEAKDRKSWAVVVSPQIMTILDDCLGREDLDGETNARLVENKRLVAHFTTLGVIQPMTDNCHPLSSLDYQMKCIVLQSIRCRKYRHFIFITDFPKSHPDSNLFLDCGIDMMNMPEFLSAFVGKSVIDKPEQQSLGEDV